MNEVLDSLRKPYTEHVIDEVFAAIENNPKWRKQYDELCDVLGKIVVNTWGGYWVANSLGKVGEHEIPSRKSSLIASYSLLDTDAVPARKPKESEAVQLMSDYYQLHKGSLPASVRAHRQLIVELIMEGMAADQAFARVRKGDSSAT